MTRTRGLSQPSVFKLSKTGWWSGSPKGECNGVEQWTCLTQFNPYNHVPRVNQVSVSTKMAEHYREKAKHCRQTSTLKAKLNYYKLGRPGWKFYKGCCLCVVTCICINGWSDGGDVAVETNWGWYTLAPFPVWSTLVPFPGCSILHTHVHIYTVYRV